MFLIDIYLSCCTIISVRKDWEFITAWSSDYYDVAMLEIVENLFGE